MLELLLCSAVTILPDFLYRRFAQGKRLGREITLFSVWYELRWGITLCLILTRLAHHHDLLLPPLDPSAVLVFRTSPSCPRPAAGWRRSTSISISASRQGQPLFRLDNTEHRATIETATAADRRGRGHRWRSPKAQLAEAEGKIVQARGTLQQALDEYNIRAELMRRNPNAISQREVERAQVPGRHRAGRSSTRRSPARLPSSRRSTSSSRRRRRAPRRRSSRREVELAKTLVYAGVDGIVAAVRRCAPATW